ncbi:Methyl-viologen-reducing hydrogenase, delta subunit [Desulfacinum infernum DSM 9756]|uniref:Methyl-viologen-reducing hydrogenase, delta subunit n=1 Tax=Desulfacinum infernum DSM 9756 TaxID=1121391 RepID=A0A1M5CX76_9BACT|nr:Methyl-viologen-reducing hydrogenase, delta subunit [Desulfacinum infernum DSM 9756]
MGLEGRLRLEWISSAEAQKFAKVVWDFTEQIRAMGPSPITVRRRLMEEAQRIPPEPKTADRVLEAGSGARVSPETSLLWEGMGGCDA